MSWENNPYDHPEKFGLRQVAEVDMAPGGFDYDLLVVWAGEAGLYLGTDSGCSCGYPFESYAGPEDMTGPLTVEQALEECSALKASHYWPTYDLDSWNAFILDVRGYLKGAEQ